MAWLGPHGDTLWSSVIRDVLLPQLDKLSVFVLYLCCIRVVLLLYLRFTFIVGVLHLFCVCISVFGSGVPREAISGRQ